MHHWRPVIVAVAALHGLPTSAYAEGGEGSQDFFAKVGLGAGWSSMSASHDQDHAGVKELELSGASVTFEAAAGIGLTRQVALGFAYYGSVAPAASGTYRQLSWEESEQDSTGRFGVGVFGIVAYLYLDPGRHSYINLCVGYSYVDPPAKTDQAFLSDGLMTGLPGIAFGLGYDFWLSRRFALGPSFWFALADTGGGVYSPMATGNVLAIGLSATTF